jgi:hypothetical protein
VLSEKLREGQPIEDADLAEVQRRREPTVRTIQRLQRVMQDGSSVRPLRHKERNRTALAACACS